MLINAIIFASALTVSNGHNEILSGEQAFPVDSFTQDDKTLVRFSVHSDQYYLYGERFNLVNDAGEAVSYAYTNPGEPHYDEFFGETYIYRDEAILIVFSDEPFTVTYQGCKDSVLCYPPMQKHFNKE